MGRFHRGKAGQVVVLAVMVDLLAVEEAAQDLDGFGEAALASCRSIERDGCVRS